ncbi:MAG: acetyl-CoA carboxylase biotin carboxyl carrier protein [Cetobacterium sp.]|uniref:acetyl-CoA carboxylase biotin carboxyl carrier protein n=1 Tax=Cetobacterium sp. TaxID=2071632 RepID=UPI003F41AE47
MKLDLESIKKLAKSIGEHNLSEISVEVNGTKLTLKKEEAKDESLTPVKYISHPVEEIADGYKELESELEEIEDAIEITSPMVGTYYSTPSPDSESFVKLGDKIEVGDTICIVEAMKMMNEVKSTISGTIVAIKAIDGKAIKKGEILFLVK